MILSNVLTCVTTLIPRIRFRLLPVPSSFAEHVLFCPSPSLPFFFFGSATITKERTYLVSSVGCSAASRGGHILWLG